MNHNSNFLKDRNKSRKKGKKKANIDSPHDIADPNKLPAEQSDSKKKPFDGFWNIYSDGLLDIITTQTNIYANQHEGLNPQATSKEIKVVISILLLSGYWRVPCYKMYRSTSPDSHNESVPKAISRNCFREIFSNLHIPDNNDIDDYRYYKIRLLFCIFNSNFRRCVCKKQCQWKYDTILWQTW